MTSVEMISAMTVTTKYSCLEASHARSFFLAPSNCATTTAPPVASAEKMLIHDFDMVRYVTGSEAVEISAVGSCLVNPNLQEESGIPDVDTAVVTMKMANGCIAVINNSRQAVYGYDQRVEAFGSKGMASDANDLLNTTTVLTKDGAHSEKPLWFFLERYNQAFINQVISFVDAINNDTQTAVGAIDGLRPVLMAKAATESCRNGGVYVKVEE